MFKLHVLDSAVMHDDTVTAEHLKFSHQPKHMAWKVRD